MDSLADAFNEQLKATRTVFEHQGGAILQSLEEEPRMKIWVESDTPALIKHEFGRLNVIGTARGDNPVSEAVRRNFEERWRADEEIGETTKRMLELDTALDVALDQAIMDLEEAIQRIATRYESESPDD